jgi:nicotinate-nucleotide pyrophosphorylase (carboxylating)
MTPEQIVQNALTEDIGSGDITTALCVPAELTARARIIARQPLVVAGVSVLPLLFENPGIRVQDGDRLNDGGEIALVRGPARDLLTRERVALNFLQRLCGIATLTRNYVDAISGTNCRILDTRKTTPGLRTLEKMATAAGGAVNHRMGLYDAVLIKNNHITAAGGVRSALALAKNTTLPVEIELRTIGELHEALECGATHLLLDNLTPAQAASWIRTIGGRATVELSGGITLESVRAYAETGADYISVGALTHSAPAVDINFRLELDR